jgi:4-hydroxy-4-methyl-2-oxoglutarate aldolase
VAIEIGERIDTNAPIPWVGAATLHEAYGRRGAIDPQIKPIDSGMRLFGRAFPVRCRAGSNLAIHQAIYAAGPGDVLAVEIAEGDEHSYGYWGEIMSEAAKARGLAGLVINGAVRDAAALASVGLPVFARGLCIRGTSKEPTSNAFPSRIQISSIHVNAGDYLIGDADGVVCIAEGDWEQTLHRGRQRDTDEAVLIDKLRAGRTTLELLKLAS